MAEFKFACPVCGQHITADSTNSGSQIECPTCFRRLIVPQAPASGQSNLILSAVEAAGRPATGVGRKKRRTSVARGSLIGTGVLLLFLCGVAAGIYGFRHRIYRIHDPAEARTGKPDHDVPTNIAWTLDLRQEQFPAMPASGRIHGKPFVCEKATFRGGALSLRGEDYLGVSIFLYARDAEQLSGKTIEVKPDRKPPLPRVALRWKDEREGMRSEFLHGGYALKMAFDQAANGSLPGKLYICLPDASNSFVAGTFEAEIKKLPHVHTNAPAKTAN